MLITNTMMVKLTDPKLKPTRAHATDAGADLKSSAKHVIYPGEIKTVGTGVAVKIPEGFVGLVFSRSGMGKSGITLANSVGVIDADYRGEVKVMLQNSSDNPYSIEIGDRIAQLVVTPIVTPEFITFEGEEEDWNTTARGTGGFGSSGKQ
jgi:dUTP pyrophosphatase